MTTIIGDMIMIKDRLLPSKTRQVLLALTLLAASTQLATTSIQAEELLPNGSAPQLTSSSLTTANSADQAPLNTASSTPTNADSISKASTGNMLLSTATSAQALSPITLEDYQTASASQLAEWARQNRVTGDQLLDLALETIKQTNPDLNNVISIREDIARQESHQMTDSGQPFYKVPILVKGLGHSISGGSNTNGLAFLDGKTSQSTSGFVKKLQEAGFVVIGQSSFPEMGWINVTNSDLYGITHNPWQLDKNPGGSSGGSAAAVASGQVSLASASDGGGSTRIPASWSGLIGLHPSRGILEGNPSSEKSNVSHFALTKSMEDTEKLFQFLLKEKAKSQQNTQVLTRDIPIAYTTQTPAGTPISDEAVLAVKEAVAFLNQKGFKTIEVPYPINGQDMMKHYYTIAASSAPSINFMAQQALKRPLQKEDVELLSWALYQTGKDLTKEDLAKAWEGVAQLSKQLDDFYKDYPIFLTPTTAYPAPAADYHHISPDLIAPLSDMSNLSKEEKLDLIYRQWLPAWTLTPFTQLANLTGTPSLSLPTHLTASGLPLGILFNSKANNDTLLLQMGKVFENAHLFHLHTAPKAVQAAQTSLKTDTNKDLTLQKERTPEKVSVFVNYKTQTSYKTDKQATLPEAGEQENKATLLGQVLIVTTLSTLLATVFKKKYQD